MHSRFSKRGALVGGLLALALLAVLPGVASAVPERGAAPRGFRLFARSLGAITVNRVYCGLATTGEVCVDSNNSSTIGGGFWPKGTADQYVFNSGLQIAGIIDPGGAGNPWAGDTTGGFFFDPKGTTQHGLQVEPIYNSQNPEDFANWPAAANVPSGDVVGNLYFPSLRGEKIASQGEVWWISWEGNPGQAAGRPHPLGIAVEQRGMGWNYPAGNEDIIYFTYTFYNITSLDPADYAAIRPGMREIMIARANDFHQLNNAAFGIDLPDEGYTITDMYAAFAADMDVGDAGENYSSVHLPFALGNTYEASFGQPAGWTFDPTIFRPPFFPGVGFVGVKYLSSPTGAGEIQLFSNTINGGTFGDPRNTTQLWRYLSGNISTAAGDAPCEQGPPQATRLCYINNAEVADMRFFQSSTALSLAPGEFGTIVVAYIFAAPVAVQSFVPGGDTPPGDPLRFASPTQLATSGANMVDSLAGFLDFTDANGNGLAEQSEYEVVPGSLLGKALVAQSVFDARFLLPFAPASPEFYLVPGDNQVTVLWRPTATEATGDAYFSVASQFETLPEGGGLPVENPLYDPNYRQFDVEGYRVYRGRVDAPNSLTLLAQFDYTGTVISDFTGAVNPTVVCAPDLGIFTDCPAAYDPLSFTAEGFPGEQLTISYDVPLTGIITQSPVGGRVARANGEALMVVLDSALISESNGNFPGLEDTGVPFIYVDNAVRDNFRYFYSVTAFDVNSIKSGPSSLESPRITKAVTPGVVATNQDYATTFSMAVFGRNGEVPNNGTPTLDPATGKFSGPFPPANGLEPEIVGFAKELISESGSLSIRLDSLTMGNGYEGIASSYYLTVNPGPDEFQMVSVIEQEVFDATHSDSKSFFFTKPDPTLAQQFGVNPETQLAAGYTLNVPGNYYTNTFSRGCANGANGFGGGGTCSYNGARWFDGPSPASNETMDNPTAPAANRWDAGAPPPVDPNNGGQLTGVSIIHQHKAYTTLQNTYRAFQGALGAAVRAADFNVYWGAGGVVDSVIDVTHDVVVPFRTDASASWGILNTSDGAAGGSEDGDGAKLTIADWGCVSPLDQIQTRLTCTAGAPYELSSTAELGSVALTFSSDGATAGAAPLAQPGFSMYLAGQIFFFSMAALPAEGAVWTMRSYTGAINNGRGGPAGDEGDYAFTEKVRPMSAVGAEVRITFDVVNQLGTPTLAELEQVHTVPDPYYVTNEYEQTTDNKVLQFVNLPDAATIRIYSSSGVLVDIIEHNTINSDGTATWDLLNRNDQVVASGVYFYHIEAGDARRVGRFTVVNFAQ
ncbi:MAG TPA: T9SS type A sorting domain-containing protein [Gemmatimonadales bacterium]|nr:T9SS type A sorting domain-containing protein [Gemmatimonadales bacterium]